jgi:hypothetical protein
MPEAESSASEEDQAQNVMKKLTSMIETKKDTVESLTLPIDWSLKTSIVVSSSLSLEWITNQVRTLPLRERRVELG